MTAIAKYNDKKKELVSHAKQKHMPTLVIELLEAGVKPAIRDMDNNELLSKSKLFLSGICGVIGIRDRGNIVQKGAEFINILKKYYPQITFTEIRLAFEMAVVGELDQWLPKNKHGEPDRDHYQEFNMVYYTKILNAFLKKRSSVWSNARESCNLLLSQNSLVLSEEEKQDNRNAFLQDIYDAFDLYKKEGTSPKFVLSIFIQEFIDCKLIEKMPDIEHKHAINERSYQNKSITSNGTASRLKRFSLHKIFLDPEIKTKNDAITRVFDRLIAEKKDIRNYIK